MAADLLALLMLPLRTVTDLGAPVTGADSRAVRL